MFKQAAPPWPMSSSALAASSASASTSATVHVPRTAASATSAFLLDVDGVLADFTGHLLQRLGVSLAPSDITRWDIFSFLDEEDKEAANWLLEQSDFWREQPILPGAQEGVTALRQAGYQVVFCTSPWSSCKEWTYVRTAWLRQHFQANVRDVIIASNKHLVRGAAFLDDKPANFSAWGEANGLGNAFLFDAPYNQDVVTSNRMRGWADLPRVLERLSAAQDAGTTQPQPQLYFPY